MGGGVFQNIILIVDGTASLCKKTIQWRLRHVKFRYTVWVPGPPTEANGGDKSGRSYIPCKAQVTRSGMATRGKGVQRTRSLPVAASEPPRKKKKLKAGRCS